MLIPTFFYFRCRLAGSGTPSSFLPLGRKAVRRALTSNKTGNSSQHVFVLPASGAQVGEVGLLRMPDTTLALRPFPDVTQSAPAPRVRSHPAEVWAPEAQPFPAREALAPPVSVGTERGRSGGSRRVKLVVCSLCQRPAASPRCVLLSPVSHLTRTTEAEHAPEHRLICLWRNSLSKRNISRLATCFYRFLLRWCCAAKLFTLTCLSPESESLNSEKWVDSVLAKVRHLK